MPGGPRSHSAAVGDSPWDESVPLSGSTAIHRWTTRLLFSRRVALNWRESITVDPKVLVGKPVIHGTRLAVKLLAAGWTQQQNHPHIREEDIQACLTYAAEPMHSEHTVPLQPA